MPIDLTKTIVDAKGREYRPVMRVPYCELTPGSFYVLPQYPAMVCVVETPPQMPFMEAQSPELARRIRSQIVVMLEYMRGPFA